MSDGVARPRPRPDAISRGFWDAAERGELAIQRCAACRRFQHPPRALCKACGDAELRFETVSGEATLWSWTITHHSVLDGFDAALPYTCMVVELREQTGLLLLSDLVGREAERDNLKLGAAMRVMFPKRSGDAPVLPQFVASDRS